MYINFSIEIHKRLREFQDICKRLHEFEDIFKRLREFEDICKRWREFKEIEISRQSCRGECECKGGKL